MYKVCVVTATRAEYGLLRPLLFKLRNHPDIELCLVVTGAHLSELYGNTQKEIITDGFNDFLRVEIPLEDDSKKGMAISTGITIIKFADTLSTIQPDIIVLLGDRYEMLGVATAAHLLGIPIAHMCGGDVTEGAVDDAIRHCITKLSFLHFPGCEQSAKRIIQMGENPDRVFNVGEPGVENCRNLELLSKKELSEQINFPGVLGDYCVVTFHPVTMENNTAEKQVYDLIYAMDRFPNLSYVISKANADAGGRAINGIWEKESGKRRNWLLVDSLGVVRYLSAVKNSRLVLGNSSSGIVEVPAFRVPTVNVGDRQKGRMMAKSVICCRPISAEIVGAMKQALSYSFSKAIADCELPFGNGTTSTQIVDILLNYLNESQTGLEKVFYEIPNNK